MPRSMLSQKLFMDARDGRLDSVRKGLKAAGFDLDAQDKDVSVTTLKYVRRFTKCAMF